MRSGVKFGDTTLVDTMMKDGLMDAFNNYPMGITAENVAKQYNISREEQDRFATASQNKTETSQKMGIFKDEIVPVTIQTRKGLSLCVICLSFTPFSKGPIQLTQMSSHVMGQQLNHYHDSSLPLLRMEVGQ